MSEQQEMRTTRRTVAQMAWTVPVVSAVTAAPAMAASRPCTDPLRLNWDDFALWGPMPTSVVVGGVTISTSFTKSSAIARNPVIGRALGGVVGEQALQFGVVPATYGEWIQVTFRFSRPVVHLVVPIQDVDTHVTSDDRGWVDTAFIEPAGFNEIFRGAAITGQGTYASPWLSTTTSNTPTDSDASNITLEYQGPISQFVVTYQSAGGGAGQQGMTLYDLTFCPA